MHLVHFDKTMFERVHVIYVNKRNLSLLDEAKLKTFQQKKFIKFIYID